MRHQLVTPVVVFVGLAAVAASAGDIGVVPDSVHVRPVQGDPAPSFVVAGEILNSGTAAALSADDLDLVVFGHDGAVLEVLDSPEVAYTVWCTTEEGELFTHCISPDESAFFSARGRAPVDDIAHVETLLDACAVSTLGSLVQPGVAATVCRT